MVRLAAAILLASACLGCMDNPVKGWAYMPGPPVPALEVEKLLLRLRERGKYQVRVLDRKVRGRVVSVLRCDADDILSALNLMYVPPEFSRTETLHYWYTGVHWVRTGGMPVIKHVR
jgi:hypothetical protein